VENESRKPLELDSSLRDLDAITEWLSRRPALDERSADEIIGYNEQGHFD